MSSRPELPTRRQVEQLLDGDPANGGALGQILGAARMTGSRADTEGLGRVLAEFTAQAAGSMRATDQPTRSRFKVAIAKLAAAKLLVIGALAIVTTGGIAVAATTGAIPNPLPGSPQRPVSVTDTTSGRSAANTTVSSQPGSAGTTSSGSGATSSSARPSGPVSSTSPSPSLSGLCKSWLARPHANGNADNSAAFSVLIAAAGGVDSVDVYCTNLLTVASSNSVASTQPPGPSTSPPASATPTTAPSGKKTHSDGKVTGK